MSLEKIVERIYHGYFSINHDQIIDFSLDTDYIYAIENLVKFDGENDDYIRNFVMKRFQDSIHSDDPNIVNKLTLHLVFPLYESIDRCKVLFKSIEDIPDFDLGMNHKEFLSITHIVIFRVLLYNLYAHLKNNEDLNTQVKSGIEFIFGSNELGVWFDAKELNRLNSNISIEKIQAYLDLFSIELYEEKNKLDEFKILKSKNKYTLIFLHDFTYNLYYFLENLILKSFKQSQARISQFGGTKGIAFEDYLYVMLKHFIPNEMIYKNCFYEDLNGEKSELDLLVVLPSLILNIECKSSRFDIAFINDKKSLDKRFLSSFKRSFLSIDRFHKTHIEKSRIYLKKDNEDYSIDIGSKALVSVHATAYDIKFIASEIQRNIMENMPSLSYYPININSIDLKCMLLTTNGRLNDYRLFEKYLKERFNMINEYKHVKFDLDEIDMFGYITTDSKENKRTLKILKSSPSNATVDFLITNSIYREQVNRELSVLFLEDRIKVFTSENNHEQLNKLFHL